VNVGALALLGLRDFAAFCRQRKGASTIRTLLDLQAERRPEMIEISVRADAFCHTMVRSLVGALVAVGSGRRDRDWLAELTNLGMRDPAVRVMPPHGLTLEAVGYPPVDQLALRAEQARHRRVTPATADD
jgi:tRNA pseudouridine38-40 synthase